MHAIDKGHEIAELDNSARQWNAVADEDGQIRIGSVAAQGRSGPEPRVGARLIVNVDGGARGNPGPAAVAAVIRDADGELLERAGRADRRGDQQRRRVPGAAAGDLAGRRAGGERGRADRRLRAGGAPGQAASTRSRTPRCGSSTPRSGTRSPVRALVDPPRAARAERGRRPAGQRDARRRLSPPRAAPPPGSRSAMGPYAPRRAPGGVGLTTWSHRHRRVARSQVTPTASDSLRPWSPHPRPDRPRRPHRPRPPQGLRPRPRPRFLRRRPRLRAAAALGPATPPSSPPAATTTTSASTPGQSKGGPPPPQGTTGLFHTAILYPTRRALADALRRVQRRRHSADGRLRPWRQRSPLPRRPRRQRGRALPGPPAGGVAPRRGWRGSGDVHRAARPARPAGRAGHLSRGP